MRYVVYADRNHPTYVVNSEDEARGLVALIQAEGVAAEAFPDHTTPRRIEWLRRMWNEIK
jgi:hypothetical protein